MPDRINQSRFHPSSRLLRSARQGLLAAFAVVLVNCHTAPHDVNAQQANAQPTTAQQPPAQHTEVTPDENDSRIAWWREAKFGMFVHWGVYSVVGGQYKGQELPNSAEWMMARGKIPIAEYEQYAKQFNPVDFDADKFVGLAKQAGMKYLVITAKHHDGFAMFDSKATDYNVVDFSPFGRDIMKELAEACQKQGIKFGFYYSQAQDWHHPGGFGNSWDKSIKRVSSDQYVREKAVPEVRQLLTEYGPIGIFWWDTPRAMSEEAFNSLHSLTKLQPDVLTNDRLGEDFPGDYKTFERNIPRQAPQGKDWEVCMPISGSWGYKKSDTNFKSTRTLIQNLADIASKGGNYLLNVSPTGKGTLLPQAVERLEHIGQWMQTNGESIYGTTASPIGEPDWGRCTAKATGDGTVLYLHVFDWPQDGKLVVRGLENDVRSASLLDGGQNLSTQTVDDGVLVSVPADPPDDNNSVIKLVVSGTPEVRSLLPTPGKDGVLELFADKAFIHNNEGSRDAGLREHDGIPHVGYWLDDQAWVEWEIEIRDPGVYQVSAVMSVQEAQTEFRVSVNDSQLSASVPSTGSYGRYAQRDLGTIQISKAGRKSVRVIPTPGSWQPMNLRQLTLKRVSKTDVD
ncbi:alpha-L-fucosidase [Stieleria sp.]|uniref:alpha-L-fucosidase n=1 Tax=Stieleria sp. TaxID=2795976 RepID=UPI0035666145